MASSGSAEAAGALQQSGCAVSAVAGRAAEVAVADLVEGVAFPWLLLPPVGAQFAGPEEVGESGEGAAGVDLGQLALVADQDELAGSVLGVGEQPGEGAGAEQPGLVVVDDAPAG